MSKPSITETEHAEPPTGPRRKPWSPPRVIVSETESTESGAVNLPEANSGLLTS